MLTYLLPFLQLQGVKSNGCGNQLPFLRAGQRFGLAHQVTGQGKTQTLTRVPLCSSVKGKPHALYHGEDKIRLKEGRANPLVPTYCLQACHLACHQTRLDKTPGVMGGKNSTDLGSVKSGLGQQRGPDWHERWTGACKAATDMICTGAFSAKKQPPMHYAIVLPIPGQKTEKCRTSRRGAVLEQQLAVCFPVA